MQTERIVRLFRNGLLEVLSKWEPLDEEFPDIDDLEPAENVNL